MEEPPAGAAIVRPFQPQLAPRPFPPAGGGGGMDCPNGKRSSVAGELPEDSLVEILARVPVKCLYRSKCVATTWRDLIEDPLHRKKLPQTLQGFFFIEQQDSGLRVDYASLLARPATLQIDTSLSFLTELPGYETLTFSDSCNGLLVFEHKEKTPSPFDYVVWNPATKQWGEVPRSGPPPASMDTERYTYLVFDPAISTHFHLVQLLWECKEFEEEVVEDDDGEGYGDDDDEDGDGCFIISSVHVYSSETGQWVHIQSVCNRINLEGWHDQSLLPYCQRSWCARLNGMLHFIVSGQDQIVAVDLHGVTRKIIPMPMTIPEKCWLEHGYVAQSQGCLHYIKQAFTSQLSIWVLEDYDTQEWVLKHSVSFMELFGKCRAGHKNGYSVVGMHPDGNVVFIVQNWNLKLISYDMDHKLVKVIRTLQNGLSIMDVVPYVPCFLELPALINKH